ncbi:hypothetical protein [Paenibacillus cymbidii]|uniref:hypothetical protein n=1 Tax=Paenibacillus cymbidii TaxID=1639034 RepID=UPI00108098C3|nr:hypothetical protein [Paenibacillus cymbidii]
MFWQFSHRHRTCSVDGTAEAVILSREQKATSQRGKESEYNGLFSSASVVVTGAIVMVEDAYLVTALRKTVDGDNYCSMVKANALFSVQRYGQVDDEDPAFSTVVSSKRAYAEYVTASLRQHDPGLLPQTHYTLIVQATVDVRDPQDPSLYKADRVVMGGRNYEVASVDKMRYPNLLFVQLAEDMR